MPRFHQPVGRHRLGPGPAEGPLGPGHEGRRPGPDREQRATRGNEDDRIFPYHHKSAGTAFTRACQDLAIKDLHFHDLRHEGTSRLFEAGFAIEQVALVTGHKDWKMLRRYTHLRPEHLHDLVERGVAKRKPPPDGEPTEGDPD